MLVSVPTGRSIGRDRYDRPGVYMYGSGILSQILKCPGDLVVSRHNGHMNDCFLDAVGVPNISREQITITQLSKAPSTTMALPTNVAARKD